MRFNKIIAITGISMAAMLIGIGCRDRHRAHRFCSDDFPERILIRIDKRVNKLDLTVEQQEKYNEIRTMFKKDLIQIRDERLKMLDEFNEKLSENNPDLVKIAGEFKKIYDERRSKHQEKFNKYYYQIIELYKMLDNDQKAKIIDRLRKAWKHFNCQ